MIYKVLFLLAILTSFNYVSAETLCASGWGSTSVNGDWVETGVHNSKPYYVFDGSPADFLYYPTDGNGWYFSGNALDNGTDVLYYSPSTGGATPLASPYPSTSWSLNAGVNPIGTLASGACSSGGSSVSVATSTSDIVALGSHSFILYSLSLFSTLFLWKFYS